MDHILTEECQVFEYFLRDIKIWTSLMTDSIHLEQPPSENVLWENTADKYSGLIMSCAIIVVLHNSDAVSETTESTLRK